MHPQKNLSKKFQKKGKGLDFIGAMCYAYCIPRVRGAFKSAVPIADYETTFFKGDFHYEVCM